MMATLRPLNPWTWQDSFGFSQAVEYIGHTRVVVCAGQTSVDEDGSPVNAGDITAQVTQALDNLESVLSQAEMTLANVVRLNIYTTDVDAMLPAFGVWADRLKAADCRPTCTLLGVQRLAFPELLVELEATAVV